MTVKNAIRNRNSGKNVPLAKKWVYDKIFNKEYNPSFKKLNRHRTCRILLAYDDYSAELCGAAGDVYVLLLGYGVKTTLSVFGPILHTFRDIV